MKTNEKLITDRQRKKDIFELDIPTYKAMSIPMSPNDEPKEVFGMLDRKVDFYYDGIHEKPRKTYIYWICDENKDGMNDKHTLVDPFTIKLIEHTDIEQDDTKKEEPTTMLF